MRVEKVLDFIQEKFLSIWSLRWKRMVTRYTCFTYKDSFDGLFSHTHFWIKFWIHLISFNWNFQTFLTSTIYVKRGEIRTSNALLFFDLGWACSYWRKKNLLVYSYKIYRFTRTFKWIWIYLVWNWNFLVCSLFACLLIQGKKRKEKKICLRKIVFTLNY